MFSVKDIRKLVVVSIIGACAVFVANLFLNFYLDIEQLEISKTNPMMQTYYDAQVALSWMVAMVSGVVLSLTSVLLMCFYIKQFVDDHKEQLGILKALGYSNGQLAKRFWAFGLSFGAGALLGYFASFFMMGHFYDFRNEKGILPEITIHFCSMSISYSLLQITYHNSFPTLYFLSYSPPSSIPYALHLFLLLPLYLSPPLHLTRCFPHHYPLILYLFCHFPTSLTLHSVHITTHQF